MTDEDIQALAAGNVADMKKKLPELDGEQLRKLRDLEEGKPDDDQRKTALEAINSAIVALDEDEDEEEQAVVHEDEEEQDPAQSTDASAGAKLGDGPGGENVGLVEPAPGGAPTTPITGDVGTSLEGLDLAALEALRDSEVYGASRAKVLDAIDFRIDQLREAAHKSLLVDPTKVETRIVPTPRAVDAATKRPSKIAFGEQPNIVQHIPPVDVTPEMFSVSGGKAILQRKITVGGHNDPTMITHVILLDDEGDVAGICEVPGGLRAGGGREAEFPAGSLLF